jgi:Flp pilus assembly protein protease CpaA
MYLINIFSIMIFLVICTGFDLKNRVIPDQFLGFYLLISFFLNFGELIMFGIISLLLITFRVLIILIVFILTLILFSLNLMGGGDGKVIVLIFCSLPMNLLLAFLKFYFLFLGAIFIIIYFSFLILDFLTINLQKICKNLRFSSIKLELIISKINKKLSKYNYMKNNRVFPFIVPILISFVILTLIPF